MAYPRFDLYPAKAQALARFSRTLGHPERLHIIEMLNQYEELTVSDLVNLSPLALPTVSQHLIILRREQLINIREQVPYLWNSLNRKTLQDQTMILKAFLSEVTGRQGPAPGQRA